MAPQTFDLSNIVEMTCDQLLKLWEMLQMAYNTSLSAPNNIIPNGAGGYYTSAQLSSMMQLVVATMQRKNCSTMPPNSGGNNTMGGAVVTTIGSGAGTFGGNGHMSEPPVTNPNCGGMSPSTGNGHASEPPVTNPIGQDWSVPQPHIFGNPSANGGFGHVPAAISNIGHEISVLFHPQPPVIVPPPPPNGGTSPSGTGVATNVATAGVNPTCGSVRTSLPPVYNPNNGMGMANPPIKRKPFFSWLFGVK